MDQANSILKVENLHKLYRLGKTDVNVLRGVNLDVADDSWTALLGASGSGKTTLLNMLGTLEKPDDGVIVYDGVNFSELSHRRRVIFRRTRVGFVFQAYHMMPELTVLENVKLPGMLNGRRGKALTEAASASLERVGLGHRLKHRPNELSGGEQQRAAIARALINEPDLILADEPTGNLDSATSAGILDIFQALRGDESTRTIIMVTHDASIADLADRVLHLKDGVISDQSK